MGWLVYGRYTSQARLDGKTAVITGCNSGIGKYTALDLYTRGARVVMLCRDIKKAEEAAEFIKNKYNLSEELAGQLVIRHIDLASLSSVRNCAKQILLEEQFIHILINNAGIFGASNTVSEDGHDITFATNHLGPFLLTLLLLPRILESAPARIINVSSKMHMFSSSNDFGQANTSRPFSSCFSYCQSKLANILFTKELARRLEGTKVSVYCLHPGVIDTEIGRSFDFAFFWGVKWIFNNILNKFLNIPEEGAQTSIYCAVEESIANESGKYYEDCQELAPSSTAEDPELAKKLWDISIEMTKSSFDSPFEK